MKSIQLKNIVKRYGDNTVVNKLNLDFEAGKRTILLGPSGCGKSTILRMIAGLEDISEGDLFMGGERMNDVVPGERNVAMVFQNYALFPHMTVEENIGYALKIHKVNEKERNERVSSAIKMLELEGFEKRTPRELSGGQRQRVALARAVVKQSNYFLLDEPLSNLDAQLRVHARKELLKLHETYNQTFIYVTHDQIEAMTLGHNIALLYYGDLQMYGTPVDFYDKPANIFTATFIGSPSTNISHVTFRNGRVFIGNQNLVLPEVWQAHLTATGMDEMFIGIRPETVWVSDTPVENSLTGTVTTVENYGGRWGIHVDIDGENWIIVMKEDIPAKGSTIYMSPNFNKMHFFHPHTELNLGSPFH